MRAGGLGRDEIHLYAEGLRVRKNFRVIFFFLHLCSAKLEVPFQTERKAGLHLSLHPRKKEAAKKFLIMLYSVYFFKCTNEMYVQKKLCNII